MSSAVSSARVLPVLVLEDDASVRDLIKVVLEAASVANPIELFGSSAQFLDRLAELVAGGDAPVLVVLDLHLPDSSGLEVLAHVRGQPGLVGVPVVVVSGSGGERDIERAYELGISAYLVKPAGVTALQDMLGEFGLRFLLLPADQR